MSPAGTTPNAIPSQDRTLFILISALLTLCFVSGGSSQASNLGVMFSQLLALPIVLFALARLWQSGRTTASLTALIVLGLILLVPLLQLLPIPRWLWNLPSSRASLQQDLTTAGISGQRYRWSLAPAATERALFSLLPATALFLGALSLHRATLRKLLWAVVGLALFSLILAIAQTGAPQDSFLNPDPAFAPSMGGIFANHNHQATTLGIALVLSIALALGARRQRSSSTHSPPIFQNGVFAALAFLFVMALPMIGSRAGVIVAMVPALVVISSSGVVPYRRLRTHRPTQVIAMAGVGLLAIVVLSALAWMHTESAIENQRWAFNAETLALALANAPFGSGMGSFVALFEQGAEVSVRMSEYVNHAHDEYPQWWLEGGLLALAVMFVAFAALIRVVRHLVQLPSDSTLKATGMAASMAILVIVLHSSVDYPLRTPAVMALFGLLAGVAMTAAAQARERLMVGRGKPRDAPPCPAADSS